MPCFRPKQTDFMFANTLKTREGPSPGLSDLEQTSLPCFLFISLGRSAPALVLIESAVKYRWTQEASRLCLPLPLLHPPSRLSSLFILLSLYLPLLLRSDWSLVSRSVSSSLSPSPLTPFIMRVGIKSKGTQQSQNSSNKQAKIRKSYTKCMWTPLEII